MTLDLIAAILLVLAIIKGYKKGALLAAFSYVALIIGIAAAMKLSVVVAGYLTSQSMHSKWLSFLSFILVLLLVILGIKLVARMLEKVVQAVMLGWANKIGGILLYALVYFTIFSVLLFYTEKMGLTGPQTIAASISYPYFHNLGPWVIDHFGAIVPWFKDMFKHLSDFFAEMAARIPAQSS
ncbi:membrane protein required for colicin V production [Arachidicoccus rhizosphaerae]|uniref:Membrane protein required for colicin V production n=1 Tax=Arachidicoccus rhizosphaerae TaxID=551991 RepID=A0A1H4C0U0_9BACT|nr:CvpA family protein [Arachidicoccus rhizosphaerae]SEA53996.1 membrane protein required for colicin V production [Arachidicoccus rhizosphaerae]